MRWQLLSILLGASMAWAGPDAGMTVGRVQVTAVADDAEASEQVARTLEARLPSTTRLLSLRPRLGVPGRFDVTVYDTAAEQGYEIELNERGEEISRRPSEGQPSRAPEELAQAEALVRASALLGDGASLYEAMPPLTVDARGRRLVNVGIMASDPLAGKPLARNEIVSVHVPTGEIVRYPEGAPPTARTSTLACGPAPSTCGYQGSYCTPYEVAWPASAPVWRMKVRHPSCTSSVQPDGTGLEIQDVRYQDRLVLRRAEVPVLNVSYVGNTCGPYRDWLDQEDCFQAQGTDVPSAGSGIRVASSLPSTLCENGTDVGSFRGVAIYDEGDALLLMTETTAGWYRYVMEWRFYLDGTIEPLFGFGATSNGCTCLAHTHHAYWRFDWALDADQAPGSRLVLDRRQPGSSGNYDTIGNEAAFLRYGSLDWFRLLNTETGNGYVIQPSVDDGSANGDTFAQWDVAALVATDAEINDPNPGFQAEISLGSWLDLQPLGGADRLVTWYRAGNYHDDPAGTGEACHVVGPRLVPLAACESTLTLDRAIYACGATANVLLHDRDLAGAGQATVQVVSAEQPAGAPLVLAESPAGSGRFTGTVPLSASSTVRYVDASQCGASNVLVEKTAAIDCSPPVISDLQVALNSTNTVISWTTSEPATTVLHFGTSVPPLEQAAGLTGTSHTVTLQNLSPCTVYYFWLESADVAGNASTNLSGGYYAFKRPRTQTVTCAPVPPPPPAAGLTASRTPSGIQLAWEADCGATNYHLAYGPLALLPSYAVSGGVCGLGPLGAYNWLNVPSGNLWFVAIADDGDFVEGSWGLNGAGAQRNGTTPSSWCASARTNAGVCP